MWLTATASLAATVNALSRGALASRAAELAASTGCRHMHLDMPAWSGGGLGERPELATELAAADTPAFDVAAASRMLLKVMTTPDLPDRLALHSRVGGLAAVPSPVITRAELTAAGLPHGGRFLREVAVHYPGIELICAARLSLRTDPYLADYRIDGMPVLPPVLALEALAQVASVLAGRPLRDAARRHAGLAGAHTVRRRGRAAGMRAARRRQDHDGSSLCRQLLPGRPRHR